MNDNVIAGEFRAMAEHFSAKAELAIEDVKAFRKAGAKENAKLIEQVRKRLISWAKICNATAKHLETDSNRIKA